MKIWHISDTHTYHEQLKVPENVDMVIFSGDCSNPRDIYKSEFEIRTFLIWMSQLPIKHKILIAGNHDLGIERGLVKNFEDYGITYLFNSSVTIEGLKIWGSPYTPNFQNWAFNMARHKIGRVWDIIPEDIDILVLHGPPKGILDISYNQTGGIEFCGDSALKKRVLKLDVSLVCFGHIHNYDDHINSGVTQLSGKKTVYSNAVLVKDGRFGSLIANGNLFEIDDKKNVKIIHEKFGKFKYIS